MSAPSTSIQDSTYGVETDRRNQSGAADSVTDDFMRAVLTDGTWQTTAVTTGQPVESFRAKDLMRKMSDAAWVCGDPGIQFDTTINNWHTCSDRTDNRNDVYLSHKRNNYIR